MKFTTYYDNLKLRIAAPTQPPTPELTSVCAWCSRGMHGGAPHGEPIKNHNRMPGVTHGICKECSAKMLNQHLGKTARRKAASPVDIEMAKKVVQLYKPELVKHVSKIEDLKTGPYGLYKTGQADPTGNEPIFVNRARIHQELQAPGVSGQDNTYDPLEEVLQDAQTVVHEATHLKEHSAHEEGKGTETTEAGPKAAESDFQNWAQNNMERIKTALPQLKTLTSGMHLTTTYSKLPILRRRK